MAPIQDLYANPHFGESLLNKFRILLCSFDNLKVFPSMYSHSISKHVNSFIQMLSLVSHQFSLTSLLDELS